MGRGSLLQPSFPSLLLRYLLWRRGFLLQLLAHSPLLKNLYLGGSLLHLLLTHPTPFFRVPSLPQLLLAYPTPSKGQVFWGVPSPDFFSPTYSEDPFLEGVPSLASPFPPHSFFGGVPSPASPLSSLVLKDTFFGGGSFLQLLLAYPPTFSLPHFPLFLEIWGGGPFPTMRRPCIPLWHRRWCGVSPFPIFSWG